jgi:hypothetical protein
VATPSALARSHPPEYRRHRPEATLLYQVIEEYWPEFQAELTGCGKSCINSTVRIAMEKTDRA